MIFGKAGGHNDINLTALNFADGFVIHGSSQSEYCGVSVCKTGILYSCLFVYTILLTSVYTQATSMAMDMMT